MNRILTNKLSFKDVMIVPNTSFVNSHKDVNMVSSLKFRKSHQTWQGVPIISKQQDLSRYNVLARKKQLPCFSRAQSLALVAANELPEFMHASDTYMLTFTINDLSNIDRLMERVNVRFVNFEAENGHSVKLMTTCAMFHEKHPKTTIMAGPVVTPEAVESLIKEGGVDLVKVGNANSRRFGVGYPEISAIIECVEAANDHKAHVVSCDVHDFRDVAKPFCAGASFVALDNPSDLMIDDVETCLRACCCYIGANSIRSIKEHSRFVQIYG